MFGIRFCNCGKAANPIYISRRFRVKTKWASTQPKKTPCDLALDHFDTYYKPVFNRRWPSIRVALLSQPKYCALINNFANDRDLVQMNLSELGAHDIIRFAREIEHPDTDEDPSDNTSLPREPDIPDVKCQPTVLTDDPVQLSIHSFTPVKKIVSEKEQMRLDEVERNVFHAENDDTLGAGVISPKVPLRLPFDLMAFAQHVGDVTTFPSAKKDSSNKLGYYLMDAASLLPVIALDLEPGCSVLDLCAAPGGKSLAILQTLLPEQLTCVDRSYSRIQRLKDIMRCYVPKSYIDDEKIQIVHTNGVQFCEKSIMEKALFDRVLVDVPCYTDRHVLSEEENNIFRPSRLGERLQLQDLQKDLLFAGIRACRPGGVIVYSTCTLTPQQNDGVVQATLDRLCQETDVTVVIESTADIADRFSPTFTFAHWGQAGSRYGSLVLPKLTTNFGPMYFCRLRRIN